MRRHTHQEYSRAIREKWPLIELVSEYQGGKRLIEYICRDPMCPNAGKPQSRSAAKLLSNGCTSCAEKWRRDKRTKTDEEFRMQLEERNKKPDVLFPLLPTDKYLGATMEIGFQCITCGRSCRKTPHRVLGNRPNCPFCAKEHNRDNSAKTLKAFELQLKQRGIRHTIAEDAKYINDRENIHMICGNCGHDWWPRAGNVLNNRGYCPACKPSKKPLDEEAKRQIYTERERLGRPPVLCLGEYEGDDKPILAECKICGHKWRPTPSNLKRGKNCPRCSTSQKTSFFERWVGEMLTSVLGEENVYLRSREAIGEELDIFIPREGVAIEPGHWYFHHRQRVLSTDQRKQELCRDAGIKLLQIYVGYSEEFPPSEKGTIVPEKSLLEETQVEQILSYDSICYRDKVVSDSQTKQFVTVLLSNVLENAMQPDDPLWEQTKRRASEILKNGDARIEELRREIANPDIEILDAIKFWDNKRFRTKYRYRCNRHPNFEHTTTKQTLVKNAKKLSGCPKCPECQIEKR